MLVNGFKKSEHTELVPYGAYYCKSYCKLRLYKKYGFTLQKVNEDFSASAPNIPPVDVDMEDMSGNISKEITTDESTPMEAVQDETVTFSHPQLTTLSQDEPSEPSQTFLNPQLTTLSQSQPSESSKALSQPQLTKFSQSPKLSQSQLTTLSQSQPSESSQPFSQPSHPSSQSSHELYEPPLPTSQEIRDQEAEEKQAKLEETRGKKAKLNEFLEKCGKQIPLNFVLDKKFESCDRTTKFRVYQTLANANEATMESLINNEDDHDEVWKGFLQSGQMDKSKPLEQPSDVKEIIKYYNTTWSPQLQVR